ncbi:hypothetical protein [Neobacillus sp. PS2-9]|uniref:hypothetical protein n=1 Tax=Neobacillus sp. PS2-9 TaxID=3070676 RepID=UPI0027E1476C|nr:hypothetical protein [Neobacillus sp. PS2-9]WML57418.1 hypothetical protein RCG25_21320 [Neobacillus sp. PS2-9]
MFVESDFFDEPVTKKKGVTCPNRVRRRATGNGAKFYKRVHEAITASTDIFPNQPSHLAELPGLLLPVTAATRYRLRLLGEHLVVCIDDVMPGEEVLLVLY